jgi:predicted O-methyltransferase YrrM
MNPSWWSEFKEVWEAAKSCGILMTEAEAEALWRNAQRAPENVVECGANTGGSTVLLATASKRVTTIEPNLQAIQTLVKNMGDFDLLRKIHILPVTDNNVWPIWPNRDRISLLFLDHEHTYVSVRNSLFSWKPLLKEGAPVLVHDYSDGFPEVRQAVDDSGIHIPHLVDSLAVCTW